MTEDDSIITAKNALKEIAFGSVAGMVAEVFEYPFDLAKVRLQAQLLAPSASDTMRFEGPLHCLLQTWKAEGVRGLYRGLPAPLVGSMAETAAVFVAYSAFQNAIRTFSIPPSTDTLSVKQRPLSIPQLGLASAGAGFVTSFVLTPIELVKCKMQVQMMNIHPTLPPTPAPGRIPHRPQSMSTILPSSSSLSPSKPSKPLSGSGKQAIHDVAYRNPAAAIAKLPGPLALTRSIIETYGIRGLWLGHTGTVLRETGGCASWFVTKEWIARKLVERRVGPSPIAIANTPLQTWESGVSGAIAGAVGALMFYPADTVKSAIQTEEELRPKGVHGGLQTRSTFVGTFRKMWLKHGMKGLYAGCGMTVARAVPSSGIIFVVYDGLSAWFL